MCVCVCVCVCVYKRANVSVCLCLCICKRKIMHPENLLKHCVSVCLCISLVDFTSDEPFLQLFQAEVTSTINYLVSSSYFYYRIVCAKTRILLRRMKRTKFSGIEGCKQILLS